MPASLIFSFDKLLFSPCRKLAMDLNCCYIKCGVNPDTGAVCCVPATMPLRFIDAGIGTPCCLVGKSTTLVYSRALGYWQASVEACSTTALIRLLCIEVPPPSILQLAVSCDGGSHFIGDQIVIDQCQTCDERFAGHVTLLGSGATGNCCGTGQTVKALLGG
jgi:hypothetical protein